MNKKILCALLVFISFVNISTAQDSIPKVVTKETITKKRCCSHEIGFNSTLLIKQLFSNNPSNTLSQQPYQLVYVLHLNSKCGGNGYGIRVGVGMNQSTSETTVTGLSSPRKTNTLSGSYRLGIGKDFLNYRKFVGTAFIDGLVDQTKVNTLTETSSGSFTSRESIDSKSFAEGLGVGVGLKYSINDHIAISTEVPLQVKYTVTDEHDSNTSISSGSIIDYQTNYSHTTNISTKIFLPTSLFISIIF